MRESELHQHIANRSRGLSLLNGYRSVVGPGDDCAVLKNASGEILLLTVDQLVEGRHFETGTDIDLIARKAVARSVSDIAAMGGVPVWSLGTGVLPKGFGHGNELFDAMHKWANHWGCPLVGGDIASHTDPEHPLTLSVTIGGIMEEGHAPVLRSGAKPGDLVYVTGSIGGSFESGWHLLFEPRWVIGADASRPGSGVHAMMDLSDGLGRDADRIARASGVMIEFDATRLPINHRCADWRAACGEGEDYELLLCIHPDTDPPAGVQGPIGVCIASDSPGAVIIDAYGKRHSASEMGWDH
ncbi:MAG: thiamine-monophosphate kinase [Phycisphaerales bacterium]|nr:thiamine-monophosphate kinase [Phycisphaerales bacterium]